MISLYGFWRLCSQITGHTSTHLPMTSYIDPLPFSHFSVQSKHHVHPLPPFWSMPHPQEDWKDVPWPQLHTLPPECLVTWLGIQLMQSWLYPLALPLPFSSDTVGQMTVQSRAAFLSLLTADAPRGFVLASSVYADVADKPPSSPFLLPVKRDGAAGVT